MYQHYQQQQQQQQQQQHYPAGQPHHPREAADPHAVRQMYRRELASLTFNSKPIITSLTIAAGENATASITIVQTIEERLRTAPPTQKLPTLYLIDSIIKNVGEPYLNLFGRSIVSLFLDAYVVVDGATRSSFEKVLGTWPNWTTLLFSREAIAGINHGIQSIRMQQSASRSYQPPALDNYNTNRAMPRAPEGPPGDNVLLQDIQLLLMQKKQAMAVNPGDQASSKQIDILHQLESIVKSTQLTPEHANMIRQQLAQLIVPVSMAAPAPVPPYFQGGMPPMPPASSMAPPPSMPMPMSAPGLPFNIPPPGHFAGQPFPGPNGPTAISQPPPSQPLPVPPVTAAVPPVAAGAASNLFASLMQSGLLGPNGTLSSQLLQNVNLNRGSPSPVPAVATPPMPSAPLVPIQPVNEQDLGVMSLGPIELTSQDIQRKRPAALQVMYGTPPLQCNQCGYRCPKAVDAQKKMDAHLDWHFRQNRRLKDKAKKSHSRSWLVGEEDWVHSREGDVSQSQQPVFFDMGSGVNKASKDEQALQEEIAALKESIVSEAELSHALCRGGVMTSGAALAAIAKGCSICLEKFIKVWNDVDEEWSYKNAMVVENVIYHATCHADMVRSNLRKTALAEANGTPALASTDSPKPEPVALLSPPTSSSSSSSLAIESKLDVQHEEKKDVVTLVENGNSADYDMKETDLVASLKRKLEEDQEDQDQLVSKKTILSE